MMSDELETSERPLYERSASNMMEKLHNGFYIWKIMCVLLVAMVFILLTAAIVCGTNGHCAHHIPTIHNMLNSPLTAPFVTTSINIIQFVHILLSLALYYMCCRNAPYYNILQLIVSAIFHASLLLTLFLVTFLGWNRNWANVVSIGIWIIWMTLALKCLKRYYRYKPQRHVHRERTALKWNWVMLIGCFLFTVIYVVFRALNSTQFNFKNKDIVVLVAEVGGGLCILIFIILLIYHTRHILVSMYNEAPYIT